MVIIDGLSTEYDRWDPRLNPKWGAQTPVLLDREALVSRWGRNGEVAVWVCPSRSMGVTKTTERVWLPGCGGLFRSCFWSVLSVHAGKRVSIVRLLPTKA